MSDELDSIEDDFMYHFNIMQEYARNLAESKGWHTNDKEEGTLIALMHSELSEALEALRENNPPSEHIPSFDAVEEELADCVIRIMDMSQSRGYRLASAIVSKMRFNETRPYKHGGKKF